MGRRALRKIDPKLNLAQWLKTFEQLPRPWDAAGLFGRPEAAAAPLEVEVGSGKGLFLLSAAQAQPERNFLGIEIVHRYAEFCAARLAKRGVQNAVMAAADAGRVFHELIPSASLAAVHVYFPDPWWKSRHRKRRVMNERVVNEFERALQPGGRLHFWTDVKEYFQATLDLLAQGTRLAGPLEVVESPAAHDMDYRTNFERRVRQVGKPIYRAEFLKSPECGPPAVTTWLQTG